MQLYGSHFILSYDFRYINIYSIYYDICLVSWLVCPSVVCTSSCRCFACARLVHIRHLVQFCCNCNWWFRIAAHNLPVACYYRGRWCACIMRGCTLRMFINLTRSGNIVMIVLQYEYKWVRYFEFQLIHSHSLCQAAYFADNKFDVLYSVCVFVHKLYAYKVDARTRLLCV